MTGNENPEMEKEMTPHNEAKLSPSRKVGSVPIMTMPQHGSQYQTKSGKDHWKNTAITGKM